MLAKDNFLLAHRGLVPGVSRLVQQKERQELMMGKTKEVDEWVETGEADNGQKLVGLASKASSPDKRAGPLNEGLRGAAGDDDQELQDDGKSGKDDAEDESWMFKTFSKVTMGGKGKQAAKSKQAEQQAAR